MLEGEGWENLGGSTPRFRLDGTLDFLQNQFKHVIEDKVIYRFMQCMRTYMDTRGRKTRQEAPLSPKRTS